MFLDLPVNDMAHFALLDENNVVTRVDLVEDYKCTDAHGKVVEKKGVDFLQLLYGDDTNWKQTSYTGRIRKNFASIGGVYDPTLDAFIPQKPYRSWILDDDTCMWYAPVPKPDLENWYEWDEENVSWKLVGELMTEEEKMYVDSLKKDEN